MRIAYPWRQARPLLRGNLAQPTSKALQRCGRSHRSVSLNREHLRPLSTWLLLLVRLQAEVADGIQQRLCAAQYRIWMESEWQNGLNNKESCPHAWPWVPPTSCRPSNGQGGQCPQPASPHKQAGRAPVIKGPCLVFVRNSTEFLHTPCQHPTRTSCLGGGCLCTSSANLAMVLRKHFCHLSLLQV